ncbi:Protoglobin-domain-containing protein [Catenaria anguillulae PL171]|uniref:Protoglobin-domain-containing protein n=1 Tax=Catenaria anguillulae PL171 TaxID=765915 RepID=A0A1Y2HF43_9FUNG|nr:Protoglobin-domain-containing protein [Catenaria anguillulae PL171]
MKSIDRDRLYTDLMYRVGYVAEFIGFGPEDHKLIYESAPLIEPLVPVLVDAVYAKLFEYEITAESFAHRMQGYDGKVIHNVKDLSQKTDQIKFRKNKLKNYLLKVVTGMDNVAELIPYLDWVGLIHTANKGKTTSIHVEYIHCNALLAFVNSAFLNVIAGLPLSDEKKLKTQDAYTKMLWLQNDLFAMYYVTDGLELPNALANRHKVQHTVSTHDAERIASSSRGLDSKTMGVIGGGIAAAAVAVASYFIAHK